MLGIAFILLGVVLLARFQEARPAPAAGV